MDQHVFERKFHGEGKVEQEAIVICDFAGACCNKHVALYQMHVSRIFATHSRRSVISFHIKDQIMTLERCNKKYKKKLTDEDQTLYL